MPGCKDKGGTMAAAHLGNLGFCRPVPEEPRAEFCGEQQGGHLHHVDCGLEPAEGEDGSLQSPSQQFHSPLTAAMGLGASGGERGQPRESGAKPGDGPERGTGTRFTVRRRRGAE